MHPESGGLNDHWPEQTGQETTRSAFKGNVAKVPDLVNQDLPLRNLSTLWRQAPAAVFRGHRFLIPSRQGGAFCAALRFFAPGTGKRKGTDRSVPYGLPWAAGAGPRPTGISYPVSHILYLVSHIPYLPSTASPMGGGQRAFGQRNDKVLPKTGKLRFTFWKKCATMYLVEDGAFRGIRSPERLLFVEVAHFCSL